MAGIWNYGGLGSSAMQRALGSKPGIATPVTIPTQQSPVELLDRLKNGGVTEWQKMSYAEKMRLISQYGNGSEEEFIKQFKILTGKDLNVRSGATIQERLDPNQAMAAAGLKPLTGGSPRFAYGIPVKSRKRKPRARKTRNRTRKHRGHWK